jgi:two-component system, NarL family, invasion response regulator UvrY
MTSVVQETPGFEVAGEASSGEESLVAAAELLPDLVLIDVNLPGIDGFGGDPGGYAGTTARRPCCSFRPITRTWANSSSPSSAMAYVTESAFGPEVLEAVRSTAVR